jgi:predicted dehydrogenase
MKCLVIGFGSIGSRHARVLHELGNNVSVVSQHGTAEYPCFDELTMALAKEQPDYVVIANRTHQHHDTLATLASAGFAGMVMVEKPLFHTDMVLPQHSFENVYVAYNLRFHPLLQRLKSLLQGETIITAHAYVGQYLPDWRPGTDYRQNYSVRKLEGGGVLRDLSHELDYLNWLLGGWKQVVAIGGHFSHLAGDSDDAFGLLVAMEKCPLTMIHLNYLDRVLRREIVINTDTQTITLDLARGVLQVNQQVETCVVARDDTYRAEHLAAMNGDVTSLCSISQGLAVQALIHGAEKSMIEQRWVKR